MKKKNIIILLIVIALLVGGGIVVWKWKPKETKNSDNSPAKTPLNQLSDKELEKYFVFGLQKEIKPGGVVLTDGQVSNGRYVVPSLEKHLTKLLGKKKTRLVFQGKYTNEFSPEWDKDKLDQKIKNGEEWYIIFDKSQINSDTCNYFSKTGGIRETSYFWSTVIAILAEPEVKICKIKAEALELLKNRPFSAS